MGKNSADKCVTKIPAKCFKDYSVNGSLHLILEMLFDFQAKMGWAVIDMELCNMHHFHDLIERMTSGLKKVMSFQFSQICLMYLFVSVISSTVLSKTVDCSLVLVSQLM